MQDVAIRDNQKTAPPTFSMTPRTFDEALKFAELMAKSDLVPKDFKDKPGNILVAIQKGQEVGLSPMAALETIAVINGRASLWGDGLLGIVQGSQVYEWIDESQCSEKAGICTVKRKGEQPYTVTFTLEDAKRAGLLGKQGPWTQYTKRMLQLRARGFALRDKFADVLKGLVAAEEALDAVTILPAESAAPKSESLKEKLRAQIEAPKEVETLPVDRYTGEPKPEDGLQVAAVVPAPPVSPATQDAPAPHTLTAAEYARQQADKTPELYVDGYVGSFMPYQGSHVNEKGKKPGLFDVEDEQGTVLLRGVKYFDPSVNLASGPLRVYYRVDLYKGQEQYKLVRVVTL